MGGSKLDGRKSSNPNVLLGSIRKYFEVKRLVSDFWKLN
jgi:hypothetical protein